MDQGELTAVKRLGPDSKGTNNITLPTRPRPRDAGLASTAPHGSANEHETPEPILRSLAIIAKRFKQRICFAIGSFDAACSDSRPVLI
jgi:hypothetical protein